MKKRISLHALTAILRLFTLIAFYFSAEVLNAQSVKIYGVVSDCQTGEPLIGAVVSVSESKQKVVANTEGRFVLHTKKKGNIKLTASYVGCETQSVIVKVVEVDSIEQNICLRISENALDDVTVIGKSEIRKLRETGMPISVISQQQLSGTASNINDVLMRTVGVTVRNTGGLGSASRISVRGLEGKRMGMFIDDAPLGQLSNFVALNDIPTNMIERIEVYKGIVPYKFGGSALGGAVNVITKEYPPVYFDASYEIGSFNSHQFSTVMKRTDKKSGLQFGLGGVLSFSDNDYKMKLVNLGNRVVRRDHDMYRKQIIGSSIKATKWWFDEIKLEGIYSRTYQELQGIDQNIRAAYNFSNSLMFALKMTRNDFFLEGLDFSLDLGFVSGRYGLKDKAMQRYDWDGNVYAPVSVFGGEQGSHPSDGDNKSYDFTGRLNLGYIINQHHSLNFNVYAANTNMFPKDDLMDKALGFPVNFHSRMTNATFGLSYDLTLFDGRLQNAFTLKNFYYSSHSRSIDVYSVQSPEPVYASRNQFGLSNTLRYKFNNEWMLKGSFNSEVRIPSSEELIGNGYSILPSPALKPERTTGVNLGVLFRKNKKDGGLIELELNCFYNALQDMVRYTPDLIPTMARYRNFGTVRTMGVELEAKADVHPMLYLYGNATYQDLRDTRKFLPGTIVENPTYEKRIPNVPYLLANFGAEFHKANFFGGRNQNTRLLFDASYVHQYFYDFEMTIYQDKKIPTSFTMDTALEHSFANERWTLTFKAKNIGNRHVLSDLNCPLPGRSFAFKVRYLFH
ncbi:MAG: TonB-dependent receptor [Prevotella sp.]|nr:TonB-dependent receptor [Prevotellaceae bacterium]MDY3936414.1 TonB-dependent receptor [Prevotella sp.]